MYVGDPNHQYVLLHQRQGWRIDKKVLFIIGCLVLPVTLFCATYMILFGIYEKLLYPVPSLNGFSSMNTLHKDQHRASLYSAHQWSKGNFSEIQPNPHEALDVAKFKLVCYYNFPSGSKSLQINDIDPNLCTHLNVAFASVQNNSIYLDAKYLGYVKEAVKLKDLNKNLKVLLSVGGAFNENGFPVMVFNHTNRKTFIKSVLVFAKAHGIDGIDLDWEFPGEQPSFDKKQRMHMTQLLSELRKHISKYLNSTFLLTVAVASPVEIIDVSYDVSYMNDYVDFVNLMTYDFHYYTSFTPFTGHNSPLYPSPTDKYYLATLNINYSSHYWNYLGMDKSKVVVGLPTYGHSFRLTNPNNAGLYAPALGFGKLGLQGFVSYPQVCTFLQTNQIAPVFDMDTRSPYASKSYEWISFDDQQSLTYKAEFIKNNNFGGAMVYSLNTDDFKGICKLGVGSGKVFPLIQTIKSVLENT